MIIYPDGIEAQIGDRVSLAHGTHTGIIQQVIETDSDLKHWGLDEPGLMIDTSYAGLVFHPKFQLTEDEIEFVSRELA